MCGSGRGHADALHVLASSPGVYPASRSGVLPQAPRAVDVAARRRKRALARLRDGGVATAAGPPQVVALAERRRGCQERPCCAGWRCWLRHCGMSRISWRRLNRHRVLGGEHRAFARTLDTRNRPSPPPEIVLGRTASLTVSSSSSFSSSSSSSSLPSSSAPLCSCPRCTSPPTLRLLLLQQQLPAVSSSARVC